MPRGLVAALGLLALTAAAAAQTSPSSLGVLVDQVTALFPKVDGEILERQGDTATVSLGRRDGLLPGIALSLYREGRELRHPRTGELLGRTEQPVGRVVVEQVFEAYATGRVSQGADARPGDKARVSSGKIRLTLMPLVDGIKDNLAEAAVHELIEGLNRSGRFQVGLGDAISVALTQEGVTRADMVDGKGLAGAGERFKVEHLLVVHFKRVQNKPYMDVRLFSYPGPSALLTTALFVPPTVKPVVRGDFSASSGANRGNQTSRPSQSLLQRLLSGDWDSSAYSTGETSIPLKEVAKFPFVIVGLDVAVAPADKIPRLAVTDGERIWGYKIVERVLEAEWSFKPDARGRIFSVQFADLDGDGVLEVVANRYHPNPGLLLNSILLTTKGGKATLLSQEISQILLAVDTAGDGVRRALWGQDFEQNGFFKKGQADLVVWRDGKLVVDRKVRLPSTFRATGATFANIAGKETRALAYVDEHNRLRIAIDTEEMWRSSSPVGGGGSKLEVLTQLERSGRSFVYNAEAHPLAVDLDGDGIDEIVVPQNQVPGRMAVVYRGPAGYRFQSVNSGFEGTITGLGAIPGENGSAPSLIVAVTRFYGMLTSSGETQIIMTLPD